MGKENVNSDTDTNSAESHKSNNNKTTKRNIKLSLSKQLLVQAENAQSSSIDNGKGNSNNTDSKHISSSSSNSASSSSSSSSSTTNTNNNRNRNYNNSGKDIVNTAASKNHVDQQLEKKSLNRSRSNSSSSTSHNSSSNSNSSSINSTPSSNKQKLNKQKEQKSAQEQHFCVTTTTKEFKLRIVPLEKLLEKPLEEEQKTKELAKEPEKRSRTCRNKSIVELTDSDPDDDDEDQQSEEEVIIKRTRLPPAGTTIEKEELTKSSTKISSIQAVVRSCRVRVKRIALPQHNSLKATNATEGPKMNGGKMATSTSSTSSSSSAAPINRVATTKITINRRNVTQHQADDSNESDNDQQYDTSAVSSRADVKRSTAATTKYDEDFVQQQNSDNSDANSSDSEVMPARKKRVFNAKRKKSSDDSDFEPNAKQMPAAKKRSRIRKHSSDDSDGAGDDDDEKNKNKRKHIRKIIKTSELDISTKTATKEEEERRRRIEERQKLYNQIYEKPDSVEVTELVLDFDEETKEPLLEVDRGLLKRLKPHQVAGVKFMWDACFETLKEAEDKPGSGCILAHCMGLGKTLQIVTLSHTLLANARKTNVERVLVISPLSTLNNWAREFNHWMGFARKKNFEVYDMSRYKDKATRIFKLNEWFEEGGICVLGYDMYRILANEKAKGLRKKQREALQQALVDPGPDMVVCDEGHLLKNEKTSLSKAVTKMRTKRRIVLTGTPLQNNLKEYYCMIQFVKPNLLGTYKEYLNRFVNPITNGQYTDSTERDIRLMKHRSHILHKMLEGCIQRRDYSVLAPYLPPKHEYVVYTTLSELQQTLYEYYMTTQRDISSSDIGGKGARLFQDFQDLRRIWTHPMNLRVNSDLVIRKRLMVNDDDSMEDFICDDDEDETGGGSTSETSVDSSKSFGSGGGGNATAKGGLKMRKTRNNKNAGGGGGGIDSDMEEAATAAAEKEDPCEWWKRFVEEKELNNINHSPKLVILMRLLEQCEAIGDKVLVFSQSLQSLDVIENFLALVDSKTKGHEIEGDVSNFKGFWTPGVDYFRLDGSCSVDNREAMCKQFNDITNLRARLFLISTRAGGLGINLVAANRVVIFDVSWNPSHDTQSIFRVYRFGQVKPCYIYRLIAMGTMEQKVYERQVIKQATAKRVIDEQQISRHYNQSDLQELYRYELTPSAEHEIPILPKDRLFAELLSEHEKLLFKYHEHDSLLENEESENLSDAERKAAWSEYEAEKLRATQTQQYMSYDRGAFGAQFAANATSGNVTSNKIFGFRSDVLLQLLNMKIVKDHPELTQNQVIQLVPSYLQRLYAEMNNGDPTMYKDLLTLHATLAHPSGLYMNPLLYANQNPSAAGYFQASTAQPQPAVAGGIPMGLMPAPPVGVVPNPTVSNPAAGFDPNQVYEID